ncbi:MAG: YcfA family protein [Candidatus Magasanikbacteria bacterium GW2011_GWD2_43_18]|uniref:YcfA family protein n=1 Tax=Candidatus Magasanikbacteria bacterium GW2011_GWE2_42_7 TaxID=1619052 RepID=A0A0G1BHB5_9BACT|nr:MAG: YcfA family protein [Candidatus Magasanikbacteria bacterium GW2011_GWC2_42_27]KKS72727.1 MAG: YcfA family protein [Candidatus Magasanikbacteria bacterium GW2011_GWE2_42_7]KKT05055.1 MAG: YcfA family protein [Candidatus Magasanikbacteria bacterium GW2011_GWD2_43_18]KKT24772.1 MAG: YcfA family protein [Candidatus Magasanikbacteria bacterium GW2011_GWA2_43_9]HBB38327.1 hypothetical protein [Candidatus Magasanikbacteria bacterium]
MSGKEVIKLLKQQGWQVGRVSGSHYIIVKDGTHSIPVPVHANKDISKGLLHAIFKQAGITL